MITKLGRAGSAAGAPSKTGRDGTRHIASAVLNTRMAQAGQVEYLGEIPLFVLASARPTLVSSPIEGQELQDTWLELQQELTNLSGNSEIKLLEESGHYIQFDQPRVVIEAIQEVVRECLPIQKP